MESSIHRATIVDKDKVIIWVNNSEVDIADLSVRNPLKRSWVCLWIFLEVIICYTSLLSVMCYLYYYSDYSFDFFLLLWYAICSIVCLIFFSFVRGEGWAYTTSLTPPLYYFLSVCTKLGKWAVMILCFMGVKGFLLFPQFTSWVTRQVFYKKQELLTFREQQCSSLVFGGIRVAHHIGFLCSWFPLLFSLTFIYRVQRLELVGILWSTNKHVM